MNNKVRVCVWVFMFKMMFFYVLSLCVLYEWFCKLFIIFLMIIFYLCKYSLFMKLCFIYVEDIDRYVLKKILFIKVKVRKFDI